MAADAAAQARRTTSPAGSTRPATEWCARVLQGGASDADPDAELLAAQGVGLTSCAAARAKPGDRRRRAQVGHRSPSHVGRRDDTPLRQGGCPHRLSPSSQARSGGRAATRRGGPPPLRPGLALRRHGAARGQVPFRASRDASGPGAASPGDRSRPEGARAPGAACAAAAARTAVRARGQSATRWTRAEPSALSIAATVTARASRWPSSASASGLTRYVSTRFTMPRPPSIATCRH